MVGYAANSATGTYRMYNPATKWAILTCDVKWHVFDGSNAANNPTFFDFTWGTGKKTNIRKIARNKKENDNKTRLKRKITSTNSVWV